MRKLKPNHVTAKAHLPLPKPIHIKVLPCDISKMGISIPQIHYEVVASMELNEVFKGMVMPMPRVLMHYLSHLELLIVTAIMEEIADKGECNLTGDQLSKRLMISKPSVYATLYILRMAGLVKERGRGCKSGKHREICWKTIQHLNDLCEGEDPGVYRRIRKYSRKRSIEKLNKEDIMNSYDNKVLPPDHDPAEEEEYD